MALKATIYKADLSISDMDRGYYASHNLTIAQHPSETLERMMLRLIAFARHASETLTFTKGLCDDDEPELWQKNYSDEIELWVDLGEPDEKRLKKASARADQAVLYSYGGRAAEVWWPQIAGKLDRLDNLAVWSIEPATLAELVAMVERSMQLTVTVQDGQLWVADASRNVLVEFAKLKEARH